MTKLIRGGAALLLYFCLATCLAQAISLVYLAATHRLDGPKLGQMAAVLQGTEGASVPQSSVPPPSLLSAEQPSYEQVLEVRAVKVRNLELREQALRDGLDQLRQQQRKLADERKQIQQLREAFDKELRTTREGALAAGGEQARQILETIKPKQAKEQLLDMLKNDEMDKVVMLLAGMSDSKRAKIVGEFRTPEEAQQLSEIIRRIREGAPEAALSEATQQGLQPPQPLSSTGTQR